MAITVFPQAVLAPDVYAELSTVMAEHNATAFTNGFPSGARAELGDGWYMGRTNDWGLEQAVTDTLFSLDIPYVTVKAFPDKLLHWPVVWHAPNPRTGATDSTGLGLPAAVAQGWFDPTSFRHTGTPGHLVLAAVAAGGVLARTRPAHTAQG